jgi:serine/threonine-protein phosphatase PGAM5
VEFRMSWRILSKLTGAVSIAGASYYFVQNSYELKLKKAFASWTTNYSPYVEWDANWDHRATTSLVKPIPKDSSPEKENTYNEKLEKHRSKAVRHIIMIRHGQYNLNGATDPERILTELGRQQAKSTGQRLSELKIPIDNFVISTMTRAQETGKIILEQLPIKEKISIKNCSLIEEGAPIPPEPKVGHWRPEPAVSNKNISSLSIIDDIFSYFSSSLKMDPESRRGSELTFTGQTPLSLKTRTQ